MGQYKRRKRHPEQQIRLQERDYRTLEFFYDMDGFASIEQVHRWSYPGKHITGCRRRLWQLYDNRYLNRFESQPQPVYWLAKKGYRALAGRRGNKEPRSEDLSRTKMPVKRQDVKHHLRTNDVRMAVYEAVEAHPKITIQKQITDLQFSRMKGMKVRLQKRGGKSVTKAVVPDCFHHIAILGNGSKADHFGLLWEVDNATHPHDRFAYFKVRAGVSYLKSQVYKEQTGLHFGRWYVVTTGERRLQNLRQTTVDEGGAWAFFFTTYDQLMEAPEAILTSPIWLQADRDQPVSIVNA